MLVDGRADCCCPNPYFTNGGAEPLYFGQVESNCGTRCGHFRCEMNEGGDGVRHDIGEADDGKGLVVQGESVAI